MRHLRGAGHAIYPWGQGQTRTAGRPAPGAGCRRRRGACLLRALAGGTSGRGFPCGDLGEVLCEGRVDATGAIRWVEVCYCREYYGVAMEEELPYLEEYLTEIEVADARSPKYC